MAHSAHKQTLIADLANARTELVGYGQALSHDLDVGAKLKRGLRENPAAWFGGAAVLGLLLSRITAPRRKVIVKSAGFRRSQTEQAGKAAFALTALKFGFDLVKPALFAWVKNRAFARQGSSKA